jgi:phosphatidate cytidylyltransferase
MLRQRVITALVLLALLLPALFAASPWPFALLSLLMVAAGAWEWARLNGLQGVAAWASAGLLAVLGLAWLGRGPVPELLPQLWWLVFAGWVLGGCLILRLGVAGWPSLGGGLRWALGMAILSAAWLAMLQARVMGLGFLLSVFCLVWAADIAAYFGGRAWGRRKLAPAISPGKSWEGVASGMAGVLLLAVLWLWLVEPHLPAAQGSLFGVLLGRSGPLVMALGLLFLSAASVVGDLVESLVKRAAGAKDSSGLLPGHGGVLDRIDALLPVLPMAIALVQG